MGFNNKKGMFKLEIPSGFDGVRTEQKKLMRHDRQLVMQNRKLMRHDRQLMMHNRKLMSHDRQKRKLMMQSRKH